MSKCRAVLLFFLSFIIPLLINQPSSFIKAQSVFLPLENRVYDFLERQQLRGLISLDSEVKPFTRMYVAIKLIELTEEIKNELERQELTFWLSEFDPEITRINNPQNQNKNLNAPSALLDYKSRWNLWDYGDENFYVRLNPIAGYGIKTVGDESGHIQWWGASMFAAYSDWFGASIDLRDKGEFGNNIDRTKSFSAERGAWVKNAPDGIEYSDVKGSISFDWGWGNVSLIKDYMNWGSGEFGQLIVSDKAPSFPHLKLQLKPTEWFRFYYIHGWLNSLVYDSSSFYYSYPESLQPNLRKRYIPKYIAANMFTFSATDWLDVSAGNSIVYSGDIRPEFLIPFMFFKFLDHNTGRGDVGDGNGQMFFDVSILYPHTYKFYTTLFIDVTEIRNILENNFKNTWIGFTLGGKKVDLFIPNFNLTIEYTHITPWVYEHKDEVTTYKHIDYYLGHWLGQNADQIRAQFDYSFLRGLDLSLYFERVRKGGLEDIYYAYDGMDEKALPFLYDPLREDFRLGLIVNYELIHDLNFSATYNFSDIQDSQTGSRTPEFMLGKKHSFSLTLFFNL